MVGIRKLISWWQGLPIPWRAWRIVGRVEMGDEVPQRLPDKGVILVGRANHLSWAVFDCPCREGHRLMVNLDQSRYPFWRIQTYNPLSIHPSIDNVTSQRRCHFMLFGGRVLWI